ncbi:hypothetical protein GCM10027048_06780 [Hymenobacter coalescens]
MSPADPHFQAPAPAAAHLPAAVLRQYAAGTLPAAERRRVERHTLDCALCADALDGYLAEPAATSPAALAELQQRLHARVATEPARALRPAPAWWLAAAAAAVLLLVFVGLWQQRPARVAASRQTARTPAARSQPAAPVSAADQAVSAAPEPAAPLAEAAPAAPAPVAEAAVQDKAVAPPSYAVARPPRRRARPAPTRPARVSEDVALQSEMAAAPAGNAAPVSTATVAAVADTPAAAVESPVAGTVAAAGAPPVAAKAGGGAPAAANASAPAESGPVREEGSARKSALPPAPALAPFPNGGYPALRQYLIREQRRPPGAPLTDGVVKLKFTVEADGSVQNIQVVRGMSPELDEEAIRLICDGPAWRPGIVGGRRASQTVLLDVPFR